MGSNKQSIVACQCDSFSKLHPPLEKSMDALGGGMEKFGENRMIARDQWGAITTASCG